MHLMGSEHTEQPFTLIIQPCLFKFIQASSSHVEVYLDY